MSGRQSYVPWTPAEEDSLRSMLAAGVSVPDAAKTLGRGRTSVQQKANKLGCGPIQKARKSGDAPRPRAEPGVRTTEANPDEQVVESPASARITTLEQLLAAAKVDLDQWEVERFVVNKWEVGATVDTGILVEPLFQVKAWLRRAKGASTLAKLREGLLADIRAERREVVGPRRPVSLPMPDGRHMLVVSLFDVHFGKLAWGEETGGDDYDLGIATARFEAAIEQLLAHAAGFPLTRILFPIGNDLLQVDSSSNTTTKGTAVDTDSRYVKAFRTARRAVSRAIRRLSEVAPTVVIVVPGNHDRQTAFHLGEVIEAEFQGTPRVSVQCDARLRKYVRYGTTLLGFTHGSDERHADLPLIMAQEARADWADTTHREWLTGHLHKSKETRFTAGDSFKGVKVRILPALCAADAWHAEQGYVGEHAAAQCFVYHWTRGYVGHFEAAIPAPAPVAAVAA